MNLNFQFYSSHYNNTTDYPSWIKAERYSYCENFYRIFSLFKRK